MLVKTEWLGYRIVKKKLWRYVKPFSYNISVWRTDVSVLTRDNKTEWLIVNCLPLVEEESKDWSDHALWWPENNTWLVRTRWTLDKYGVTGDSTLWFTPMHRNLRITLPDLQTIDARINFSANVFNNVIALCRKFSKYKIWANACLRSAHEINRLCICLAYWPTNQSRV